MSTSANVIEFRITKNNKVVGYFSKHLLCTFPLYSDLLKYLPLSEHEITPFGYDEDEEYWEDETQNLENFLRKKIPLDEKIKEYFK